MKRILLFMIVVLIFLVTGGNVFADSVKVDYNEGLISFECDATFDNEKLFINSEDLLNIQSITYDDGYFYKGKLLEFGVTDMLEKDGKEYVWSRKVSELIGGYIYFDSYYKILYITDFPRLSSMFVDRHIKLINGIEPFKDVFSSESYLGQGIMKAYEEDVVSLYTVKGEFIKELHPRRKGIYNVLGNFKYGLAFEFGYEDVGFYNSDGQYRYKRTNEVNRLIDVNGNEVFSCPNGYKINEYDSKYAVLSSTEVGIALRLINLNGEFVNQIVYDQCRIIGDDLFYTESQGNRGLLHADGTYVDLNKYRSDTIIYKDNLLMVQINGKYGYIDKYGNVVIPVIYDRTIGYFSEGVTGVMKGKMEYFINTSNQKVVEVKAPYHIRFTGWTGGFHDGLTIVSHMKSTGYVDKGYAYMDRIGKIVIGPTREDVHKFSKGYAIVEPLDKRVPRAPAKLIDKNGNIVLVNE